MGGRVRLQAHPSPLCEVGEAGGRKVSGSPG